MAAEVLAGAGAAVTIYDRMPSLGRKFLLAGRGGLNLTHSEPLESFLARYGPAAPRLSSAIEALPPGALRDWADGLGQETFVGSSGRVFPKAMKASPLLRAWLARLGAGGVATRLRHTWMGWDAAGALTFATPDGPLSVTADVTVLALGGASWSRMGSDGRWVGSLSSAGVRVAPLVPANCGFVAGWSAVFRDRFEGHPLKRVALVHGAQQVRGEAVVTRHGLEGGAVYAISSSVRDAILAAGEATVHIDLLPDVASSALVTRLGSRGKQSVATFLKRLGLAPVAVGLLNETAYRGGFGVGTLAPEALAALVKAVPIRFVDTAPLDGAISTAGGVGFEEVDAHFMLRARPGVFVAGEMLDWEAPTGGYLLQASFATGAAAARGALAWTGAAGSADELSTPSSSA